MDSCLKFLFRVVKRKERTEIAVRWPCRQEMEHAASIQETNRQYGPLLKGVFALTDGGRMPCADYTNLDLQNAYFGNFAQNVGVTKLFVWNFLGEFIHAAVNYANSWHETKLAGVSGLYFPKLSDEMTPLGFAILGDSVFVKTRRSRMGRCCEVAKLTKPMTYPSLRH